MDEKELNKYMYEKAIDERRHLLSNYNWWTNMFAIINGALFIALYSLKSENGNVLRIVIPFIGIVASFAWFLFIKSYYSWIESWIKVVSFYEMEFSKSQNETEGKYMYRLFAGDNYPFSTQKVTKTFSVVLIGAWIVVLIWKVINIIGFESIQKSLEERSIPNFVFFLIFFILIIVVFASISKKKILRNVLCDDLSDSHKQLKLEGRKFSIKDFEEGCNKS